MSRRKIILLVVVIVVLCVCLAMTIAFLLGGYWYITSRPAAPTAVTAASSPEPTRPPTPGSAGGDILFELRDPFMEEPRVGDLKFRLQELGYEICTVTSAFYNYQTEAAVRHFQAVNGLAANGAVDTGTWEALFSGNAFPAPPVDAPQAHMETLFPAAGGTAMATDGKTTWILDGSTFNAFDLQNRDFAGFFSIQALPGEETYQPSAVFFDGKYLWVAQQGQEDGLLQAYDPAQSSPVEALFIPVFDSSVHFPSSKLYPSMAFDGHWLWIVAEDLSNQQVLLQPVDINNRTAGEPVHLGMSSGYGSGYSLVFDARSGLLWVVYGDEIFGESAVVWVNPVTGEVGKALGTCGRQMAFDGRSLWIAGETGMLQAVDPSSGEVVAQTKLEEGVSTMVSDAGKVWVLGNSGLLLVAKMP
jgi:peptidoglycan hydrolase-like protein with peptidoglycan-binding domain